VTEMLKYVALVLMLGGAGTALPVLPAISDSDFLHALPAQSEAATGTNADTARTIPVCIKDYVTAETTVHKVDPAQVDLNGLTVPVRIIIGADGKVEHVHVISATPAQRQAIEQALGQWEFKPPEVMGHPTAVETGLTFQFRPHGP
jgi:outer membrane biosynthesis protein TonB